MPSIHPPHMRSFSRLRAGIATCSRLTPLMAALAAGSAFAQSPERTGDLESLAQVTVESSRNSQLGIADSANAGVVTQQQLEARTVYRSEERRVGKECV